MKPGNYAGLFCACFRSLADARASERGGKSQKINDLTFMLAISQNGIRTRAVSISGDQQHETGKIHKTARPGKQVFSFKVVVDIETVAGVYIGHQSAVNGQVVENDA